MWKEFIEMCECAAELLGEICDLIVDKFVGHCVGIIDFIFIHDGKHQEERTKRAIRTIKKLLGIEVDL